MNKINHKSLTNSFFFKPSTTEEVSSIIKNLNNKKAIQENDVETKFLKISNANISPFISNIFNSSIKQEKFPDALKKAETIPIFKKADVNLFTNYRPISILPQFSKIWEKLIFNRIYVYLEKLNLLSVTQFGFRQNYSTTPAISYIYDKLIKNADSGLYSCCIFLDLTKAFDTVDHSKLLNKMETQFSFRGLSLDFIQSYLSNRSQYTKINNHQSYLSNVNCGVPQGSSLGPLLFLRYINDLPTASSFKTILFADDAFLTLSDKNLNCLQKRVNNKLFKIDLWLRTNKLSLNYSKTSLMIISKHPSTTFKKTFKFRLILTL